MQTAAKLRIDLGDILKADSDVIALKYAQDSYGADAAVARRLCAYGTDPDTLCPADGAHVLLRSNGAVHAKHVLFVGVPPLHLFSYEHIRRLGASVLRILKEELPRTSSWQ